MTMIRSFLFIVSFVVAAAAYAAGADHSRHAAAPTPAAENAYRPVLHDLDVVDQNGRGMRFVRDVVADRIVVINFTYTTCTTICPILDSILVRLQERLGPRLGKEVGLVTLSIDPVTDTPARLKQHARKLAARDGWTLLTGRKSDMDTILRGLDMWAPDILNHPPAIIIGDARLGIWKRLYGYPTAARVEAAIDEITVRRGGTASSHKHAAVAPATADPLTGPGADSAKKSRDYFTDLRVATHDGKLVRFYSDLLQDKVVLLQFFYTGCTMQAPQQAKTLTELQEQLGDLLGTEVFIVSITVDPEHDTPEKVREYAATVHPRVGWTFVSGSKPNIDWINYRLGNFRENPADHSAVYLVGDVAASHWVKVAPDAGAGLLAGHLRKLVAAKKVGPPLAKAAP